MEIAYNNINTYIKTIGKPKDTTKDEKIVTELFDSGLSALNVGLGVAQYLGTIINKNKPEDKEKKE